MGEITKEAMRDRMGNIELIRDIIFGPKLQEYDARLDKLEATISSLEKEMRDRTEQAKTESLAELRTAVESIEEKITSLSFTSQKDNADIRQLVEQTYRNFSSNLESIDKAVVSQTGSIRKELSETREKLQEDTRSLKSQVFDELEKRFALLQDAKLSRNDVAEMMFELGLRIKKAEFAPGLKEASPNNGSDDALLIEASKISE
jgi:Skp family chaperone for outer membrane proteins